MRKIWSKDEIRENMQSSDKWLIRGLLAIYKGQTETEQEQFQTIEHNGIGFNGFDAEFLTSVAQQVLERRTLTANQVSAVRRAMLKYSGQLAKIANAA